MFALFGTSKRIASLEDDNRGLRARIAHLERELTRRRADAVLSQRIARAHDAAHAVEPEGASPVDVANVSDNRTAYALVIVSTWKNIDQVAAAINFAARIASLDPRLSSVAGVSPGRIAVTAGTVINVLVDEGPRAAAEVLRRDRRRLTVDTFALGAESLLYALALALGPRWIDTVRSAWCLAIDDVSTALGFAQGAEPFFDDQEMLSDSAG